MTTIRLIRLPSVLELTGYSRASIYRLMNSGDFPAAVKLGARAIAWRSTDIDAWIASRLPAVEVAQ
jgi:prophage regulatory protein